MQLLHTSKTSTSLLTTKLLLCFSTENPDGLSASSDVLEWLPCSSEHTAGQSKELTCAYRISKTGEHMLIKEWKKCMDSRKEVLGSKRKRSARIGDRMISILHNGESGPILFYAILP